MTETRNRIEDIWGPRTPYKGAWPARTDEHTIATPDKWVQSACVLCSNGCAMDIGVKDRKIVGVRGRAGDRVNHGRLGPKGLHGWVANSSSDRLTQPMLKRDGKLVPVSWDEAMSEIVSRCRKTISDSGTNSIAFYTSGQLFLEEYFTLCTIAKPGIGTLHLDGNTRLCTATAEQAMAETFGCDGQIASYSDIDVTDCLLLAGHNVSNTQTVLWARMLDRLHGPDRPQLIVIDPRTTATTREADVHLTPRVGTNLALMNGLLHLMIKHDYVDRAFIDKHSHGFDHLERTVARYTPEHVEKITGVSPGKLNQAAEILGTTPTLVSTVLQGFYQSHQATAASVQVNNVNLIRGLIAKPGCGILQMNGQPTAQNTREAGCNGSLPCFANFSNPAHVEKLAERWNVDEIRVPSWHLPAHAMEIFRHCEEGLVKMLWISATNPAVSMPELHRVRKILQSEKLFVVLQDCFMTETAELADLVLPAAMWAEKTGAFTNADRTVHLSEKAIEPPGEARSDLDIWLDFARRMDFRDKDGQPLIKWSNAEEAFNAWCAFSEGWNCDYSGLSYDKLRGPSGIQWPCNKSHPDGCERLYTDLQFPTSAQVCQIFGHDLETGAAVSPQEYRANDPGGRVIIKAAEYTEPIESTDDKFPFLLTTGRVVYQFHTRTKTARAPELNEAAPDPFVEICEHDATKLKIADGDVIEVYSRRGTLRAPAKIADILPGHLFVPFHYGYWDRPDADSAANELTISAWDPVSKQPLFKIAAVNVIKPGAVTDVGKMASAVVSHAVDETKELVDKALGAAHVPRLRAGEMISLCIHANETLANACKEVAARYFEELNVQEALHTVSRFSTDAADALKPFEEKYGKTMTAESSLLKSVLEPMRAGPYGLLRDFQGLYVLSSDAHCSAILVEKASQALFDEPFVAACARVLELSKRRDAFFKTELEHRSGMVLSIKW